MCDHCLWFFICTVDIKNTHTLEPCHELNFWCLNQIIFAYSDYKTAHLPGDIPDIQWLILLTQNI